MTVDPEKEALRDFCMFIGLAFFGAFMIGCLL